MKKRRGAARFLQYGIALVLLSTAAAKLLDLRGFARVLETYRVFRPAALPPVAIAVTAAELGLGSLLWSGRFLPQAASASAALHAGYAAWSSAALARGLRLQNCGCFGAFLARPLTFWTVAEDLAIAGLSVALSRLAAAEKEAK